MTNDISDLAAMTGASEAPDVQPEASEETLVATLQADLMKFRDLAMRSAADFENFRKRAAREKEDAIKFANASLLERLLPILDNFELGLQAARGNSAAKDIVVGMDMVGKQLADFLVANGVEPIEAEGQKFDPHLHEAVSQEASAELPEGVVTKQLRRGFKLRERLLRPSMVVVSKGPAA